MKKKGVALARVLICRTDNIGDVVLTLPLAAYIKQHHPGAVVDFLVRAYAAPVARRCAFVDEVLALEDYPLAQQMFAARGYDTVIFAFPHRRLSTAAKRARVAQRVGTSHRLFHWISCNRLAHFSRVKSDLHEAQLNFFLLRPLGMAQRIPELADIPPMYGVTAPRLPQVDALRAEAGCNVVLHPKSNGNGREWPLVRYTELARLLQDQGVTLWITGSAAEGEQIAREAPALLALPHVRNLCGRFDLHGLAALIGAAGGLVASGTGPLHLAAALGIPVLGLFPPVKPVDAARWGALGIQARSLTAPQACATCTGAAACSCMESISAAAVCAQVVAWRAEAL